MEAMDSSVAVHGGSDRGAGGAVDGCQGRLDSFSCPLPADVPDECVHAGTHAAGGADRASPEDSAGKSCSGPAVGTDAGPGGRDSESEDGCSSQSASLEACMTPSGQDYYLRRGGTPRRRSALRLSRIIARQQLLQRLSRGRDTAFSDLCSFLWTK